MLSYDFIKAMYGYGFSINTYVELGQITAEQYQEITGKPYQTV